MTQEYTNLEACVDAIVARLGTQLVIGTPLGLGKANLLLNAIYQRALADKNLSVTIITALTLEVPHAKSDLEQRFMQPLLERWFSGYPQLDYARARQQGALPDNVTVHEFFLTPGKFLRNAQAQQDYISSNYTHVARDMLSRGVNLVVQMASPGVEEKSNRLSLSCNPDVSLELAPKMRAQSKQGGLPVMIVAETNQALPYMYGDADVEKTFFDAIYTPPEKSYPLFSMPKSSINATDYAIGLHASALIKDCGTLQIGIGSLGDAVAYSLGLRQEHNTVYNKLLQEISSPQSRAVQILLGETGTFKDGLYGATEMFVDGFLYLFDKGILSREVYDDSAVQELINQGKLEKRVSAASLDSLEAASLFQYPLDAEAASYLQSLGILAQKAIVQNDRLIANGEEILFEQSRDTLREALIQHALGTELADPAVMHGGFYLGNQHFYTRLHELNEIQRGLLKMTSVERINQLYRGERMDRAQRLRSRFINTCLMVTLNGAIVSDGLNNNNVVSGVGGQYNFIAMAHALDDARSIIKLRSTYQAKDGLRSNIVFNYAHTTIPRHLRDVVVTEYGSADLRGRSDAECAALLINIADSRFQKEILDAAKASKKLPAKYAIPKEYQQNTPQRIKQLISLYQAQGFFDPFPISCDFTPEELQIGAALKKLKAQTASLGGKLKLFLGSMFVGGGEDFQQQLKHLKLDQATGIKEKLLRRMVLSVLKKI